MEGRKIVIEIFLYSSLYSDSGKAKSPRFTWLELLGNRESGREGKDVRWIGLHKSDSSWDYFEFSIYKKETIRTVNLIILNMVCYDSTISREFSFAAIEYTVFIVYSQLYLYWRGFWRSLNTLSARILNSRLRVNYLNQLSPCHIRSV